MPQFKPDDEIWNYSHRKSLAVLHMKLAFTEFCLTTVPLPRQAALPDAHCTLHYFPRDISEGNSPNKLLHLNTQFFLHRNWTSHRIWFREPMSWKSGGEATKRWGRYECGWSFVTSLAMSRRRMRKHEREGGTTIYETESDSSSSSPTLSTPVPASNFYPPAHDRKQSCRRWKSELWSKWQNSSTLQLLIRNTITFQSNVPNWDNLFN